MTDHVRCAGSVRVARVGCGGSGVMGSRIVVGVTQVGFAGTVPLVDHQVDGHLALQTADVTVAKVVAQLVNLSVKSTTKKEKIRMSFVNTHWR